MSANVAQVDPAAAQPGQIAERRGVGEGDRRDRRRDPARSPDDRRSEVDCIDQAGLVRIAVARDKSSPVQTPEVDWETAMGGRAMEAARGRRAERSPHSV